MKLRKGMVVRWFRQDKWWCFKLNENSGFNVHLYNYIIRYRQNFASLLSPNDLEKRSTPRLYFNRGDVVFASVVFTLVIH
jgi:hypothetical protein